MKCETRHGPKREGISSKHASRPSYYRQQLVGIYFNVEIVDMLSSRIPSALGLCRLTQTRSGAK